MSLYWNFKLKEVLDRKGITQKQLAEMTGLREATISEMVNNTRTVVNKTHLLKVMEALDIVDITELIEIKKIV